MLADAQLVVRAGLRPQPDGSMSLVVRDGADDEWRELLVIPAEDSMTTGPVAFPADGRSLLLVSSVDAQAARLIRV